MFVLGVLVDVDVLVWVGVLVLVAVCVVVCVFDGVVLVESGVSVLVIVLYL